MPLSQTERIRQTFEQAALTHEAALGLKPEDWAQYREINTAHDKAVLQEKRDFRCEYKMRVNAARKGLIDKAGRKERNFVHRMFGRDGFDKATIDHQARVLVRQDHERRLERLEIEKDTAIAGVLTRAEKKRDLADKLKGEFERTTDRREGKERRQPKPKAQSKPRRRSR